VKILNANWRPGAEGEDGQFEILIITEDDQRHTMPATAASMAAVVALARADTVMAWDPADRRLIIANIVGQMPWTVRDDGS
jgi:hypothetical protein